MTLIDTLSAAVDVASTVVSTGTIPDPGPVQPPGTEGVSTVISWAKWIGYALAAIAVIILGARMLFGGRRGEGGEHAAAIGWILGGIIIIGGGVGIVATLMGG